MKLTVLKKERKYYSKNDKANGIQTFGDNNDYPQIVDEIVAGSATGKPCIDIYRKFIRGGGFIDDTFYGKILNRKNETSDTILRRISEDFAKFNGFYLHVNYNANYKICEIFHIPFENARLGVVNEAGIMDKICVHWDWGRRFSAIRKWRKEDIVKIDIFNPNPALIKIQVEDAGGWDKYKGQVFMYSGDGTNTYPTPIFEQVLTDMSTEQGISNISYRNARSNFLMSGMLIDIDNNTESEEQDSDLENQFLNFQGDEEAVNILYAKVKSKEEIPTFLKFSGANYDKEFMVTEESANKKIGRAFIQPPILRSEDVGSNFGADAIKNAYDFYNSITSEQRLDIQAVFIELFKYWYEPIEYKFDIAPLAYLATAEDSKIKEDVFTILADTVLTPDQKRAMLKLFFALADADIQSLVPDVDTQKPSEV